jgi:ribosomal protein L27
VFKVLKQSIVVTTIIIVFLIGWNASTAFSEPEIVKIEVPSQIKQISELSSPSDWIKEEDIHVYQNKVVIDIQDPIWATFTDTNSMDPVLDENAHAIEIRPKTPQDISIGDIIAYKKGSKIIIHRVTSINYDHAWYAIVKGDNNPVEDPGRVRFKDIQYVLVAIIY